MIPLFTVSQIREADKYSINTLGIPGIILMENAARSVYETVIQKLNPDRSKPVGFICGKGNNGGDGFAVARHFINKGYYVKVIYLANPDEMSADAKLNYNLLKNMISDSTESSLIRYKSLKDLKPLKECSVIFDALLGSGATGNLAGPYSDIIHEINNIESFKVAVDIPTGLDADTGYGENVFNANITISLAEIKRGLFYNKGVIHSGEVIKGYIGTPEEYFSSLEVEDYLIEPEDAYYGLPERKKDYHKYSAGKILIIAGSANLPGAAFLTASASLKSGAGSAILAFPESLKILAQSRLNEVIVESYPDKGTGYLRNENFNDLKKRLDWMDVLAIGPGLGRNDETISAVQCIIKSYRNKKIVIDADAIFALGNEVYKDMNLENCILTPHYGEFANLLGISIEDLQKDPLEIGKSFTSENKCLLILKGAPTVIFNSEGEAFINTTGNSGMAKFGTGDVLTGIISGLVAKKDYIEEAAISAVYLHSLSADLIAREKTEYGYTALDIMNNLPFTINFLRNSFA